ncbi:cold-shock protein [Pseudomonas taiwanensis]|nr:cold-shock protein [Pseudomonas taiwanensis]
MDRGFVTVYHAFKGYGFIRREKGRDVFFFYDDIADGQEEFIVGDAVEFEVRIEGKGPRAYDVKRVS